MYATAAKSWRRGAVTQSPTMSSTERRGICLNGREEGDDETGERVRTNKAEAEVMKTAEMIPGVLHRQNFVSSWTGAKFPDTILEARLRTARQSIGQHTHGLPNI